jgi:YVTN family beta-propeller protein
VAIQTDQRLGAELAGYRIDRPIGRGGMSVVYLAEDLRLGRRVALKLLAPELGADRQFRERFLSESRVAASLDHSHVVPVYDAGEADGQLFIAMRYVEGTSLRALLGREGTLPAERAVEIAAQVAGALDHAHARGLVHRDVKPANVLVAREAGADVAYLADFGITRPVAAETSPTHHGGPIGTADYMAPEQIERGHIDGRTDVYGLGCLLFECLTGRPPFQSDSLMALLWAHVNDPPPRASALAPGVPAALDAVLARALAKAPHARYATCRALVADARTVVAGGRVPLGLRRWEWGRRARAPRTMALAAGAVAAVAVAALLLVPRGGEATAGPAATEDSLQRIDPRTNSVTASAPVRTPVSRIAAGEGAVWALTPERRSFVRIDSSSGELAGVGSTLGDPTGIATGLGALWIANRAGPTANSTTLLKVDARAPNRARAFSLTAQQRWPQEDTGGDIAVSTLPESRGVWLANPSGLSVQRIRPFGSAVATIPIQGLPPRLLAVAPGAVWATHPWGVVRIEPRANRVVAGISLPFTPRGIAADGRWLWLANGTGNTVWQIDAATSRVVRRIRVGREPSGIALAAGSVWVANRMDGTVSRIDPTGRVVASIPVGGRPESVAPSEDAVWVATHAPLPGKLTAAQYKTELRRIHDRVYDLARDVVQPVHRARTGLTLQNDVTQLDPEIGNQLRVLNERLAAEIRALKLPDALAADQRRYLEGLAALGSLYVRLAEAFASHDYDMLLLAFSELDSEWIRIRARMSDELRSATASWPLSRS